MFAMAAATSLVRDEDMVSGDFSRDYVRLILRGISQIENKTYIEMKNTLLLE